MARQEALRAPQSRVIRDSPPAATSLRQHRVKLDYVASSECQRRDERLEPPELDVAEEDSVGGTSRPTLNAERVLREALRLADEEGLDAVGMRRLGRELGAGAMSLYHYFASKDALLDAMIDVVFEEIELPPEESDWRSAIRYRATSVRQVLARHPWRMARWSRGRHRGPRTSATTKRSPPACDGRALGS